MKKCPFLHTELTIKGVHLINYRWYDQIIDPVCTNHWCLVWFLPLNWILSLRMGFLSELTVPCLKFSVTSHTEGRLLLVTFIL